MGEPGQLGDAVVETCRSAAAGAAAAVVWAVLEPLDCRLFRYDYSDVAVLGKAVTGGRGWRSAGLAIHTANGAMFGLGYAAARRRSRRAPRHLAIGLALGEHVALYPLSYLVDRFHPRRGEPGVPPLWPEPRAFGQATLRHAIFGWLLARLAG